MIFFALNRWWNLVCDVCIFSVLADFEESRNDRQKLGILDFLKTGAIPSPLWNLNKLLFLNDFFCIKQMMKRSLWRLYFQCPCRFRRVPKWLSKSGNIRFFYRNCPRCQMHGFHYFLIIFFPLDAWRNVVCDVCIFSLTTDFEGFRNHL